MSKENNNYVTPIINHRENELRLAKREADTAAFASSESPAALTEPKKLRYSNKDPTDSVVHEVHSGDDAGPFASGVATIDPAGNVKKKGSKKAKPNPTTEMSTPLCVLSEESMLRIRKEKSYTLPTIRRGVLVSSPVWVEGYFQQIELTLEGKQIVNNPDLHEIYPGLFKILHDTHPCVCMLCYSQDSKTLEKCVFSVKNYNPSNLRTHLKSQHDRSECPKIYDDAIEQRVASIFKGSNPQKVKEISSFFKTKNEANKDLKNVQDDINENMYKFFASANIATRQGSNEYLFKAMESCIKNASVLRSNPKQVRFSRYKYITQQEKHFLIFAKTVQEAVKNTMEYYSSKTGNNEVPFICVSHDGWDSKRNDLLGVSIHFIIPFLCLNISLPIGLKYLRSKKAVDVVNQINEILRRYSFNML
jgi:hypothetical protein